MGLQFIYMYNQLSISQSQNHSKLLISQSKFSGIENLLWDISSLREQELEFRENVQIIVFDIWGTLSNRCLRYVRQIFLYIRCHNPIMQQYSDIAYQSSR